MLRKIFLPAIKSSWTSRTAWIVALLTLTPITILNEWGLMIRITNAVSNPQSYFWFFSRVRTDAFGFRNILETAISDPIGIISIILAFALVLTLIFFIAWIVINAQAIIIYTQAPKNIHTRFSLQAALTKVEKLWIPLLQLNVALILARILAISFLLLSTALLANGITSFLNWIIFTAVIIGITLFSFTIRVTIFKVVLEKKNIKEAFLESRKIVQKNAASCYELSFLIYLFSLIILAIVLYLIFLVVSPIEFGITFLSIILLKSGVLPLIVTIVLSIVIAIVAGWIALMKYSVWLTWYTEMTKHGKAYAYSHHLVNFIRSHVKRTKIN